MGWFSSNRQRKVLKDRARKMRKEPAPADAAPWEALRAQKLGVNFRRQHPIGRYIAGFLAPVPKLIIEADGEIHDLRQLEDGERQGNLEAGEFQLLRFTNDDVLRDLKPVLVRIKEEIHRLGVQRGRRRDSEA